MAAFIFVAMIAPEDVPALKGTNRGGLNRLWLMFERDILSMPVYDPFQEYYVGDLQLNPGAQAYSIYFTRRSGKFNDNGNISSAAGDFFQHQLSFSTPKDRPALRTLADKLRNSRVTIIYKDSNFEWKIVRNLRSKPSIQTNTFGRYNGHQYTFSGATKRPAGFWQYDINQEVIYDPDPFGPVQTPIVPDPPPEVFLPVRVSLGVLSGAQFNLPVGTPSDNDRVFIYREGSLVPWGPYLSRVGLVTTIDWPLDSEFIEVVYF